MFIVSVAMVSLSFLILVICILSRFFLVSLLEACQFYWSFQRINFWFQWFFSIIFLSFYFTHLCSNFYCVFFFFLLFVLGLYCSSFSIFLRWKLRLLMLSLSSFLIYAFYGINFLLSTAFLIPQTLTSCTFICIYFHLDNFFSFSCDFFLRRHAV